MFLSAAKKDSDVFTPRVWIKLHVFVPEFHLWSTSCVFTPVPTEPRLSWIQTQISSALRNLSHLRFRVWSSEPNQVWTSPEKILLHTEESGTRDLIKLRIYTWIHFAAGSFLHMDFEKALEPPPPSVVQLQPLLWDHVEGRLKSGWKLKYF